MATRFDVAGRLAEGLAAVDDVQTYVNASRVRGYVNPDLTLHAEQVRDWYNTEDGLDLHLLDADSAQLRIAAQAADETLRDVRSQATALADAWDGGGGDAVAEFIRRHCMVGATVSDAVRSAADACATLRDELWRVVDHKVGAAVSIDDRAQSQRGGWLAAARAVAAGAATEDDPSGTIVDTQVKPFVDSTIRGDWVPAMRSSIGEVTASYRAAMDAIGSRAAARFEVPGDLGPRYAPPVSAPAAAAVVPAGVPGATRSAAAGPLDSTWPGGPADSGLLSDLLPSSATGALPAPAAVTVPPPPVGPNPLGALASPASPTAPAGAGSLPSSPTGALPDLAGGIGDLPGRLADLFGGLLDGPADDIGASPDQPELPDGPAADDPDHPDGPDDPADAESTADPETADAAHPPDCDCDTGPVAPEPGPVAPEPQAADPVPAPVTPPAAPAAEPSGAPAPPGPPAPPAGATPCEIGADELPQAGQ